MKKIESSKSTKKDLDARSGDISREVAVYMDVKNLILKQTGLHAKKVGLAAPKIEFIPKDDEIEIKMYMNGEKIDKLELLRHFAKSLGTLRNPFKISMDFSDFSLTGKKRKIRLDKGLLRFTKKGELNSADMEALVRAYEIGQPMKVEHFMDDLGALGAMVYESKKKRSFDELAGYDVVKREIKNIIILPLEQPGLYTKIAKRTRKYHESAVPRAILFEGASGTGKTTIAKIIASKVKLPLVYVPVESILSKWLGKSEKNLGRVYDLCENMGGALLFLDEIDALSVKRSQDIHEATRRILSVLLTKLGGLEPVRNVTTIAATNRKDDLDVALLSRFDAIIHFDLPTMEERMAILSLYAKHMSGGEIQKLARMTDKLSGGNIKRVCVSAERHWAAKYLDKKVRRMAPKIEEYIDILKNQEREINLPQYQ